MSERWHEASTSDWGLGVVRVSVWAPTFEQFHPTRPDKTNFDVEALVVESGELARWGWTPEDAADRMARAVPRALMGIDDEEQLLAALTDPQRPSGQEPYVHDLGKVAYILWNRLVAWPDHFSSPPENAGQITYGFDYKPPKPGEAYRVMSKLWLGL